METLVSWVTDKALRTIHIFDEETTSTQGNATIVTPKKDVSRYRRVALGLITSKDSQEWYSICRQVCPIGVSIEPYNKDVWDSMFLEKLPLIEVEVVKMLTDERNKSSARTLMDILQRRIRNKWSSGNDSPKGMIGVQTSDNTKIVFQVMD